MRWRRSMRRPGPEPDTIRLSDPRHDRVAGLVNRDWRSFEPPLPLVVSRLRGIVSGAFYDVGANTGFYSVLAAKTLDCSVIRPFEPVPAIAELCRHNLAANDVPATVVEVALADRDASATLYLPDPGHGLVEKSASLLPDFSRVVTGSITVPTRTLDGMNEREFGAERVGFVKIDVEGAEVDVLAGAVGVVTRDRPLLTVELLPRADFGWITGFLAAHDYDVVSLSAAAGCHLEATAVYREDSWNQMLVPRERAAEVLAAVQ